MYRGTEKAILRQENRGYYDMMGMLLDRSKLF